jgi:hypothetical protein
MVLEGRHDLGRACLTKQLNERLEPGCEAIGGADWITRQQGNGDAIILIERINRAGNQLEGPCTGCDPHPHHTITKHRARRQRKGSAT